MKNEKEIILPSRSTSDMLHTTFYNLVEGITGLATSERRDLILSVGHIVQRLRTTSLLNSLRQEWNHYRDKGRIREDYQYTDQHLNCLQELLEFLDKDIPDEIRFTTLKKIFFVAAQEGISDRNSHLPLHFIRLCKAMSSGEVLVLQTTYEAAKTEKYKDESRFGTRKWLEFIADHSSLVFPELVESFESELIKKHLITDRVHPDRSGVILGKNFRLTGLGHMLCSYIEKYDEDKVFESIS